MKNYNAAKELVKEKYQKIALSSNNCGCGTGCCGDEPNEMADNYSSLEGYYADADLGLGCGLPTEFAKIKEGDTVIDLGSGAGNDAFVARSIVGEKGRVIGIDFTPAMIERANANVAKIGYSNVEFRQGDIEDMPVRDGIANVIVSNCVLNLVPNKQNVFREIYRALKPGGHFSISDIVLHGDLPEGLQTSAEMYVGCVSGAVQKETYLQYISDAGFENITLQKERRIELPDEILLNYISAQQLDEFRRAGSGIYSINVYASKPAKDARNCCEPGNGCC